MAKQTFPAVDSESLGWDAELESWRDILANQPYPLVSFATVGALPTASQNDDGLCVVATNDDVDYTGIMPHLSTGSGWIKLAPQANEVADLTDSSGGSSGGDTIAVISDPGDAPATADALRDDLVANTIAELRDAIATLAAKFNEHLAAEKDTGAMASS